jgi:hypothetical protein
MNLSDLTIEQYKQWKNEGFNDIEILDKLYYSTWSQPLLTNWKRKNGLLPARKSRAKNRILAGLTVKKYASWKYNGWDRQQIAEKLRVSPTTIDQWVREQKQKGNIPNRTIYKYDWIQFL